MDNKNTNSEDKNGGKVSTPLAGAAPKDNSCGSCGNKSPVMMVIIFAAILLVIGFMVFGGDKKDNLDAKITAAMDVVNEETGNKEANDFPYTDVLDNVGIPAPSH